MTEVKNRAQFTSVKYKEHFAYWQRYIASHDKGYTFSNGKNTKSLSKSVSTKKYKFSDDVNTGIIGLARNQDKAVFVIVAGLLSLVLQKFSGKKSIVIDTPLDKDGDIDVIHYDKVNLFFNSDENGSLKAYLNQVKELISNSYKYQNFPPQLVLQKEHQVDIFKSNILMPVSYTHLTLPTKRIV